MKLAEFNYNLPKKLIAQTPKKPRDLSRLLVLDKEKGKIEHKHFYDLPKYLKKGDTLVMNNSKVIPARLWGRKETGGKIEVLLLNKINDSTWECLLGGKGRRKNLNINFDKEFVGKVIT
ncbi:tRNA preQ1(34) S-adenosylmethionine ribosyltransferase-isomerase QueA, partial [bacterium (Candidatus Torokbacteria) CG_4_10_14_0_2_um_filter_35_8]